MTQGERKRGSTRHRPETARKHEAIIKAASELFGEQGTANTTLQDIADKMGMTHAGILHHFGSKEDLLMEVLKYRDERDLDEYESHHLPDGIDLFRHLVKTAFANMNRKGAVLTFVALSSESVTKDNPGRGYFKNRYRMLRGSIMNALSLMMTGQDDPNRLSPELHRRVDRAAASVLAVMDGLQLQWLLEPEAVNLGEVTGFALRAIVHAVVHDDSEKEF